MTVNHQQQLVIDLTHNQIDEEYLETLCDEVKTNTNIGYIIWGARNEKKLNGNHLLTQVEETIKLNNTRYERFPSDYTHCLLANHCRQSSINTDGKLLKKLENLGWKVEVTFKEEKKRYVSILYKNEAKKQLVLAFRGAKMEVKDIFVDDEQLDGRLQETIGRLVSHQSCNAYQHAKAAFEMSQELGYSISFTGYSYGSWLAEKCVYFCFREFSTLDIRAVTFESPGSLDMIQLLVQSNLLGTNHFSQSPSHNLNDLDKLLDVRTYLFSPNFINTYNSHFGKVYRLYEADSDSKAAKLIDEFMMEKFLPSIPDHSTRETFHKWYDTIRNDGLINKYSFFLNGLRHLLVDDLDWILAELESNSRRREVLVWPKLNFTSPMSNLDNIEINTAQFLVDFILFGNSIPENVRKLVLRPIDWVVSNGLRAITRNQLSGIAIIFNLLFEIKNGNLGENQCLACFEYYDKIFEHPESLVIMYDKPDIKVTYQAEYRVRQIDPYSDRLSRMPPHIDRKLVEFYFDLNDDVYFNSPVREQFDELKKLFAVNEEWNGKMFVGHVRSLHLQHHQIEVDRVRDRFMRLFRITEEYFEHLKKQRRMTIQNDYVVTDCIGDLEKQVYLKFEENLFENMDGLLAINKFLYIFGDSGFGKTTLAREFAYYYKKRHHSSDCLLVQFITSESFSSNLLELEKRLFGQNNTLVKEEDLIKILKSKVNSLNRKILFIFDRVENLDEVEKILETIDDQKFIITTKNERLLEKYDPKGQYGVKVNAFDEKLCLEYLRLNGIVRKDWPDIMHRCTTTLVAPKDMEIVCDNLRLKPHLTTKDVEELLRKETRYKVLYNENKLSYEILKHLAYLDGTEIDCELIKEIFMDRGGGELKSSLEHLTKSGYLKKHVSGGEITFEMHECTQSDMKEILNEDISDKNDVLTRLVYIFNSQKSSDLSELAKETRCEKLNKLKKNLRNMVKETWKEKNHDANYVSLLNKIALYNRKIAKNLENAKTAERNILEVRRSTLPENHIDIGMSLYNIGSIYDEQKNFSMALQYYNKALDIFKKQLPENHPDIAQLLHDIGSLYEDQKSYQEALAYYKQSLEYFKQTLPKNHPSIAESKKYIGNLHRKQKEFDKALEYYEKSLEILKQILPENHLKIASLLDDIGLTYSEEGEYKEALESYQLSLDIKKQKLTPLHPSIAASMDKIGLAYLEQGNYDKALEYYKKSLEIKNKSLPANHPSIAGSIKSIGLAFYEHGDYDKALDYYKKVLEIENLTLPAVHLDRAETLHNIGQVYKSQGKYDKALEYFNESLEIKKNLLPSYHPNIAKSLENIGIVYSNQGKYHTALEYYNKSLEMKRLTLDSNHPDIAQSLHNIGIVYRNQGNYTEALSYYKRALDLKLETLPPNHPGIAKSLENIGIVYRNLKEFDLSLEYYTKSLEIKKQTLPVNHPEIGQSMNNIGLVYADIGSLDSALEFYRKALEIFNQKLPPTHPYIATVLNNIKMVEQKMGDHLQSRF